MEYIGPILDIIPKNGESNGKEHENGGSIQGSSIGASFV